MYGNGNLLDEVNVIIKIPMNDNSVKYENNESGVVLVGLYKL